MAVRYKKLIKAGAKHDPLILNVDMAPTMLALAGVTPPFENTGDVDFAGAQRDRKELA